MTYRPFGSHGSHFVYRGTREATGLRIGKLGGRGRSGDETKLFYIM